MKAKEWHEYETLNDARDAMITDGKYHIGTIEISLTKARLQLWDQPDLLAEVERVGNKVINQTRETIKALESML
jgi:hypothetical protein